MTLRKGHCYTRIKRSYTRHSKYKTKDFVKGIPHSKVVRFDMGDSTKKYKKMIDLVAATDVQIRHNAIESARQVVNRRLHVGLGLNYFFKIHIYPHHILRENKVLTGAGADRMQTGMQHSFGKAIGISAQVRKNTSIFSVFINPESLVIAKAALKKATPRLPGKFIIKERDIKA